MKKILEVHKQRWIVDRIYEVSDSIRTMLTDQTKFEERCMKRVGEYLINNVGSEKNKRYIERLIGEVRSASLRRNKNEDANLFSDMVGKDEEGEEMEFEPVDALESVESEVVANEMTALLEQGGQRNKLILDCWATGNTNDAEISRVLEHALGGNSESHRRQIGRFRNQCRKDSYFTAV